MVAIGRSRSESSRSLLVSPKISIHYVGPPTKPDFHYAREKLSHVVFLLATEPGSIKERLLPASLELVILTDRDLPSSLQPDLEWVVEELSRRPGKSINVIRNGSVVSEHQGAIVATIQTMRVARAVAIAKRICEMEARLNDLLTSDAG